MLSHLRAPVWLSHYSELGNNSLEPRFAGNSRNQVSVNRVTGDTINRVTGDMATV